MNEQAQLARFSPALDKLEADAKAAGEFFYLVDQHIDPFDSLTRVIVLYADGEYAIGAADDPKMVETPDALVLAVPEIGSTESCLHQLREAMKEALIAPDV